MLVIVIIIQKSGGNKSVFRHYVQKYQSETIYCENLIEMRASQKMVDTEFHFEVSWE